MTQIAIIYLIGLRSSSNEPARKPTSRQMLCQFCYKLMKNNLRSSSTSRNTGKQRIGSTRRCRRHPQRRVGYLETALNREKTHKYLKILYKIFGTRFAV